LLHTLSLVLMNGRVTLFSNKIAKYRMHSFASILVMGIAVLSATVLHGIEAMIWAGAFRMLGALPDSKSAMLYSLNAMTSYGHENLHLEPQWRLMGALEALNGLILFGLTTAFLFTIIQKVWRHVAER
jgi:hypothetical protein